MWWQIAAGVLLVYLALVGVLWHTYRRQGNAALLRESLRLLPDAFRLLRCLAADPSLPRGVRLRLGLLIVHLSSPIDLIPDFIPVLGYADDALIVAPRIAFGHPPPPGPPRSSSTGPAAPRACGDPPSRRHPRLTAPASRRQPSLRPTRRRHGTGRQRRLIACTRTGDVRQAGPRADAGTAPSGRGRRCGAVR
ncbi:MAG TPA: YkvA family protein [Jatrophihabitantaceae bacterium]|jgi:hypothetical protein